MAGNNKQMKTSGVIHVSGMSQYIAFVVAVLVLEELLIVGVVFKWFFGVSLGVWLSGRGVG